MAETQSFVLQAREPHIKNLVCPESSGEEGDERAAEGASFKLDLSDSSHVQERAQALAMESTQAFILVEEANRGPSYSSSHPVLSENDARQVCVEDEDTPQQGIQVNVAMEATQAYISGHCSDSEDETDDDEARNIATVETQAFNLPTSFTLAMAETQPMCALEEGSNSKEMENNKAVPLMPKHSDDQTQPLPETQPVLLIDEAEITDEDSMPLLRKRKPLLLEEEQTQPLASCSVGLLETQPVSCIDDEITDEDLGPVLRKRKAKPLELEEKQTQPLVGCDVALPETQPVSFIDDKGDDSIAVLGKSKAKPLQPEDEQMQPHASCDVAQLETQPLSSIENDDDDNDEDSLPLLRKRKARPLEQLEEEQTQPLSSCDLTLDETQPVHLRGTDEQSDEDDLVPGTRRKQPRPLSSVDEETQTLVGSGLSAGTQQDGEDGDSDDDNSVIGFRRRKAQQLESQEEESQTLSLTASEKPPVLADDLDESESVDSSVRLRKRKARPLTIEEEDSQSLTDPAVSAFGTQLSETEAAGQGGDKDMQSESMGGTSRSSRAGISKSREEEEVKSAGCAETPQKQMGEKLSPNGNDTRKVEKNGEAKKQAKGKIPKTQKENQVEEDKVPRNGGLTKEPQAMHIDSEQKQDLERSQEKKMQMVETERKGNIVSKKGKKPELEHETMVGQAVVKRRKEKEDERSDREDKEKVQMDEKKEGKKLLELEKAENEQKRLYGEEKEKLVGERQEKEENGTSPKAQMGKKVSVRAKQEVEEKSIDQQRETQPSVLAARGRRATRRTIAVVCSAEPEQQASSDDVPVRRTRSRSNSVSSERSTAGPDSQQTQGRGRGRGRGSRRSSEPPSAVMTSSSSGRESTTTAPPSKRNSRARSQMEVKTESTEAQVTPPASAEGVGQRRGRKRTSGVDPQHISNTSCKISKAVEEEEEEETAQDEIPARPIRGGRGRAKRVSVRGNPDEVEVKNDDVAAAGGRRVRGRSVAANQRRKDEQDVNDDSVVDAEVT